MKLFLRELVNPVCLWVFVVVFLVVSMSSQAQNAPTEKVIKLTEVQQLQAENHKLKVLVAQYQAQANECALNTERATLTNDFMGTLAGQPGDTFDWNTLTVVKSKKEDK